jgi:hypothetical protein
VFWVEWPASGKKMPVDVEPVFDGNVVLTHRKAENKLLAEKYVGVDHPPPRKRYISHFTTCPEADQHRKTK